MRTGILIGIVSLVWMALMSLSGLGTDAVVVLSLTAVLLFQGGFSLYATIHNWIEPKRAYKSRAPRNNKSSERLTFSLIVPVRHEAKVIGDTLKAMAKINYPRELYEVLVVARQDDLETIEAIKKAIGEIAGRGKELGAGNEEVIKSVENINLVVFDGGPLNKPRHLNVGLEFAQNAFVGVFDAEDEPHPEILLRVEALVMRKKADGVQSGVQLTNVGSRWFTGLNCLEYFFWFRSVLPWLAKLGAVPLGGNTVFVKTSVMHKLGGWDEECLTEDADIGIRISASGYKLCTLYEEELVTREEAPVTIDGFVRQRTRWDQGYLQVLAKGDWKRLSTARQEWLTFYLLIQPIMRLVSVVGIVMLPLSAWGMRVPVLVSMVSFLPAYFWMLRLVVDQIGLYWLGKSFGIKIRVWDRFVAVIAYYPYEWLLSYSALRALGRTLVGMKIWEKTDHLNVHRVGVYARN